MIFYIIPLLFINIFLIFTAFRGFIISIIEGSEFYRLLGVLSIGLYAFLSCEVLLDIAEHYFPIERIQRLSETPLFALVVSILIMGLVYIHGKKWVSGYLLSLEEQ